MIGPTFGFLLLLGSFPQEPRRTVALPSPEEDAELLQSDEIGVREAAQARLAALPVSWVRFLRLRLSREADCEVRERLAGALREISSREADRLLREGDLKGCLQWLSGLPPGQECDDYVRLTKQKVERRIRYQLGVVLGTDDYVSDFKSLAETITDEAGPWGIAVLFDALSSGESDLPAAALLEGLGDEILPCLARGLKEGSGGQRREICAILYSMTSGHDQMIEDHCGISAGLSALAEDRTTDLVTQMRCRYILGRIQPGYRENVPLLEAR